MYYLGSGLIDPDVADISKQVGIAIGLGALVAGWLIYDVAATVASRQIANRVCDIWPGDDSSGGVGADSCISVVALRTSTRERSLARS